MRESLIGKHLRHGVIAASTLAGALLFPVPGSAQNVFPCGGGTDEQQVGMDTNGSVAVPLCVSRPGAPGASADGQEPVYRWTPPPLPKPPRGWKPVFGAWKSFESARIPGSEGFVYDYVISLGHTTPEEALAAVREQCMARPRVYDQQEGTCQGYLIREPYVTVVQYPYEPALGSQRGTILVYDMRTPSIDGLARLENGELVICSTPTTPLEECTRVLTTTINGEIPEQGRKKKPAKREQ